eukprot:3143520-Prymnesium_polylepis.1
MSSECSCCARCEVRSAAPAGEMRSGRGRCAASRARLHEARSAASSSQRVRSMWNLSIDLSIMSWS